MKPGSRSGALWKLCFVDRGRRNLHFYILKMDFCDFDKTSRAKSSLFLCTRDVFAISFHKRCDVATDILTIFENDSYDVLLISKSVIFSFD